MDVNSFIMKLKANGCKDDFTDLDKAFVEYKQILAKLCPKNRGLFSLNLFCMLCRNLGNFPSWSAQINKNTLLTLSIACVRETRTLGVTERVKTLAGIFHVHRYAVKQYPPLQPELILKLSYMPFESELLTEYCKTYWNILADRIIYIEKLKVNASIAKFLQKFADDTLKVIQIYDTVAFCQNILALLMKKMHYIYSAENARELNYCFGKIFNEISSKNDLKNFKKLPGKSVLDISTKLVDCFYVAAENASRTNFENSCLTIIAQTTISLVGHCPDILHCLQTIFLNGFCSMLAPNPNPAFVDTILSNFVMTCETTERLGYTKAINAMYPYINKLLRLYIDDVTSNTPKSLKNIFGIMLKIIVFLMKKLKDCEQLIKCENCTVKTGLHDALRLSFLAKHLLTVSLQQNIPISPYLSNFIQITLDQYELLKNLCALGCKNYEITFSKLQPDIHNTAITLNKSKDYDFSIKLFDIYLNNEILHFKNEKDMKNISRALYNKSICFLDCKQYENAMIDAYLSLVFAYPDGLSSCKYMSLVMDIKARALKAKDDESNDEDQPDDLQTMTVFDACVKSIENMRYGGLKAFFCNLKFSELLNHEFKLYGQLWPSIVPISAVWRALYHLSQNTVSWIAASDDGLQETLLNVVLETPTVVRTIQCDQFGDIITKLLDSYPASTTEQRIFRATLLLLKTEFNLMEATQQFGWKVEPNPDPDQVPSVRTLSQEHDALKHAFEAVDLWTEIVKNIEKVPPSRTVSLSLQITQVFVPLLLHMSHVSRGLQLAHVCCVLAERLDDQENYLRNASTIIYHANKQTDEITTLITRSSVQCAQLMKNPDTLETAIIYLCDCAIFYSKIGMLGLSAKLIQSAQAKILDSLDNKPEINLGLATGRLLESQVCACVHSPAVCVVSAGNTTHRYYLASSITGSTWTSRRLKALCLKLHIAYSGLTSCVAWRRLMTWRRARCACGSGLSSCGATTQAMFLATLTNTSSTSDAQIKIDNRLKYILGLEQSNDQPIRQASPSKSHQLFTPKQEFETMLENMTSRNAQISPTINCTIPGFVIPDFLKHKESCDCYSCENLYSAVLTCEVVGLEASVYFRAKEYQSARNYFDGALQCFNLAEIKIKTATKHKNFEGFVLKIARDLLLEQLAKVQIEVLIENAFFELAQENHKMADAKIVQIHEILQENSNISPYLRSEVLNLMVASAQLRKSSPSTITETGLESDLENLKLSPAKPVAQSKTPETKAKKPPKLPKIKVKDEEIPNSKRRIIKLNLDDNGSDQNESNTKKRTSKRNEFKIPVPDFKKPVLESMTPTPRRKIPEIIITQDNANTSGMVTPKPSHSSNKTLFFTPTQTPQEEFFTPMSSVKTYSKKSLRHTIVKNLESEFSTPNQTADVENSKSSVKPTRSGRLRQTFKIKLDDDK